MSIVESTKNVMSRNDNIVQQKLPIAIRQRIERVGVLRRFANIERVDGSGVKLPVIDQRQVASVVAENDVVPLSDAVLGQYELNVIKIITRFIASRELQEDSTDWEGIAAGQGTAVAKKEDEEGFAAINAAIQPSSIIVATGETSASAITLDSVLALIEKCPERMHAESPMFFMSRSVYAAVALRLQGAVGIIQGLAGDEGILLGHRVQFSGALPKTNATTGTNLLWFGFLHDAFTLGIRSDVRVVELNDLSADQDQLQMLTRERVGFALFDPGTATPTDPAGAFLALQLG